MTELERPFFERAVILWAGPLAQARANRKNEAGWVLVLSPERERAIHEAAHGVTGPWLGSSCIDYPSSRILEGASLMNATTQVVSVSPPIAKTMIVQSPRGQ
jgi:hypothetical protein